MPTQKEYDEMLSAARLAAALAFGAGALLGVIVMLAIILFT